MERTRVARVDHVILARRGEQVDGSLHLTPHHLIFSHVPPASNEDRATGTPVRPKELWFTYPIISLCTLRPAPAASRQLSSIRLRCRDFTFVCFYFTDEIKARTVFDSIKQWTCKSGRLEKLYAFSYQPPPPERELNGWDLYDPRKEWDRQGLNAPNSRWRLSEINVDYSVVFTYLSRLDPGTLFNFRQYNKLCWSIPLEGKNSCFDISSPCQQLYHHEKFSASERPLGNFAQAQTNLDREASDSSTDTEPQIIEADDVNPEEIEDDMLTSAQGDSEEQKKLIYGAQQNNLIVDARPTVNAFAMQAVGLGSENMDNYKFASKAYLGIDNIHVMRDSLNKVIDALKETDVTPLGPNREQLNRSGWLKHITGILDGAGLIARQVGLTHSHVLIHCSDGWDRTSQLSALSQICLDPYFRTLEGFMVLVEKDWLSFGHMFRHRSGHLSSEKWFQVENERIGGGDNNRGGFEASGAGKAIENAFLSAKGFFGRDNTSRDSLPESDGELQNFDGEPTAKKPSPIPRSIVAEKEITKVKETSPVFHQFLDATYQLLHQYPTRFEFNERFLRRLLYHLYSCQFGTFLFNSEKERKDLNARERTRSVWDYFLARREQFTNPQYDPLVDDHQRGKERLIFPLLNETRWWSEAFGRSDAEMNGPLPSGLPVPSKDEIPKPSRTPVPAGVETAQKTGTPPVTPSKVSDAATAGIAAVTSGISQLSVLKSQPKDRRGDSREEQMEVELN
ncbi:hypothetical protein N7470_008335 [Penicillium chermesinum]|nr:hypothetical protein N7470_008335 [Penicillium chermesinum]